MSLRREEAELKRALQLSTQQARTIARLSPHSLSSSRTDDSKDLELRPIMLIGETQETPIRPRHSYRVLSPDIDSPPRGTIVTCASRIDTFSSNDASSRDTQLSHIIDTSSRPIEVLDTPASHIQTSSPPARRTPASRLEVVIPLPLRRDARGSSVDPIDSFNPSSPQRPMDPPSLFESRMSISHMVNDSIVPSSANMPMSSIESANASSSRRESTRVRDNKEKEEAAKAEKKRQRAEIRRQALAEHQRAIAAGEIPPDPPKTKAKKTAGKDKPSQRDKASQKSARSSQTSQPKSTPLVDCTPLPEVYESGERSNTSPHKQATAEPAAPKASSKTSQKRKTSPFVDNSEPPQPAKRAAAPAKQTPRDTAAEPVAPPVPVSPPRPATPPRTLHPARNTPVSAPARSTPGISWKAPRNDLSSVLSKFPSAKRAGMSRRLKIVPLHQKIGPGAKALPPPPPKARKKVESEDEDDDEEAEGKVKVGSREWLMMED